MATLKFRVYVKKEDSVYRDVALKHTQNFEEFHQVILTAYEFDNKHQATFYRSNDNWQEGKEITLLKYDKAYVVEPLIMSETTIGSQIFTTTQKFIYQYNFEKPWLFLVELISVTKEAENPKDIFPKIIRKEGIAPSQYGTKGLTGTNKITEVEEKYDLTNLLADLGNEEPNIEGEDIEDGDEMGLNADTDTDTQEEL